MKKIAIVTDSNAGLTQAQGKELGIHVLPMPFYINEKLFFEEISLTQAQFYDYLKQGVDISTSQPSPMDVTEFWDRLLNEEGYDEIVHIPMSSGLSASTESAEMLSRKYNGKVQVVDNQRISVTQMQSAMDARKLADEGKDAAEIKAYLLQTKMDASIYITVDTMTYLKKGGRVTPAAAALGSLFNIKPVLSIQGEKLDAFSKAHGMKVARATMLKAIKADIEKRFSDLYKNGELAIFCVYSGTETEIPADWMKQIKEVFPEVDLVMYPLSLSVSCHIGAGALAIAVCRKKL